MARPKAGPRNADDFTQAKPSYELRGIANFSRVPKSQKAIMRAREQYVEIVTGWLDLPELPVDATRLGTCLLFNVSYGHKPASS